MKNLNALDEDQWDELPLKAKKRDGDRYHYGDDYPYRRVWRFLESRVGEPWDQVISDFVHADWVPPRRRHASELNRDVATNTFIKDGEVYYYQKYGYWGCNEAPLKDATRKTLYVHPTTKILCAFTPQSKPSRLTQAKRHNAQYMKVMGKLHQLLKIDGIWYEVKAKPSSHLIYESWYRDRVDDDPLIDIDELLPTGYSYRPARPVTIISKKELSHKELKKHGLTNNPYSDGPHCKKCGGYHCVHIRPTKLKVV